MHFYQNYCVLSHDIYKIPCNIYLELQIKVVFICHYMSVLTLPNI